MAGEILFSSLATRHNLTYYLDIMRGIRDAIMLGKFKAHLESVAQTPASAE
jgi:tRNA-guanine family transglycosylase